MDEQFDKKLTSHIREVFENYEHPPADESWMKLREKFPAKQQRGTVAWMWWSSAAAVLLVFLGVGLWLNRSQTGDDAMAVKPTKQHPITKQQPIADTLDAVRSNDLAQNNSDLIEKQRDNAEQNNTTGSYPSLSKNSARTIGSGTSAADNNIAYFSPQIKVSPSTTVANPVVNSQPAATVSQPSVVDAGNSTIASVDPAKTANNAVIAGNEPVTTKSNSVAMKQQPKSITQLLEDEKYQKPADKGLERKNNDAKVSFGVYAATFVNYAEGSSNQINGGAGITSDIRLSKNLKLSTGVALAQNSFSYNNTPPPTHGQGLVAAAPIVNQQTLFGTAAAIPQFRNYNASLVGLDIPVNIKYEFNPDKSSTYISAGVSSGTFIQERYTYTYAYTNVDAKADVVNTQTENETARKSFNSFYFGKTLNFAFGVGVPIGKHNSLIFEPFVKYPLGGLGTQQINFGSGGLNLKFNINPTKK